jgi:uncharacterized protein
MTALRALRLYPGDDLRAALSAAAGEPGGFVLSGIGSLGRACIRRAGADLATDRVGDFEILTLAGSLSPDGAHLHISVADAQGRVWGGHVAPGCTVRTTAEVLVAVLPAGMLGRAHDPATGFAELVVRAPGG